MVVAPLLAGATAFVVSSLQQKVYEAKTTLIVGQSLSAANPGYNELLVSQGLAVTYAAVAETRPILERVIARLDLDGTPKDLSDRVQVDAPRGTSFLTISVQDVVPARAAAIANELGDELISVSASIQGRDTDFQTSIDQDLASTQELIEATQERVQTLTELTSRTPQQASELQALEGRLVSLRATYATLLSVSSGSASNTVTVVEPAETSTIPVAPLPLLSSLFAAVLGLLVVAGVAFLAEQLDDSIKDADAVQEVTGLSNLGTITQMRTDRGRSAIYRMVTLLYPRSSQAEAYRRLRVNLEFASVDAPLQTLLVTSAAPGEGKTVTASNLAVAFAQAGRRVLLVDADLRRPGVDECFSVPNTHGLTTMLHGSAGEPELASQPTEQANLEVVTTGPLPPNPAELMGSQRMQTVLGVLRRSADLVIFDSPPLQAVADAAVLSTFVDGTLLVIDTGRGRRRQVRMARETLARAGANVLGVALNRVAAKESLHYGYYGQSDAGSASQALAQSGSADRSGPGPTASASR
jgi:non-specific protein-tyrosine kinase